MLAEDIAPVELVFAPALEEAVEEAPADSEEEQAERVSSAASASRGIDFLRLIFKSPCFHFILVVQQF